MKINFLFSFLLLAQFALAQTNYLTGKRIDATWNEEAQDFEVLAENEEITFFEFDKKMTKFHHTTATIASDYTIKSKKFNKEDGTYEMEIVSDVGNEYLMILDEKNARMQFLFRRDGNPFVVQHNILQKWTGGKKTVME